MATKQYTLLGAMNIFNCYAQIEFMRCTHKLSIVKACERLPLVNEDFAGKTTQVIREQYYRGKELIKDMKVVDLHVIGPVSKNQIEQFKQLQLQDIKKAAS